MPLGGCVEIRPGHTGADNGAPGAGIDFDTFHRREVDEQSTMAFLYPIVSAWQLDIFPIVLASLGFGSLVLIIVGAQVAEIEPPNDRYPY